MYSVHERLCVLACQENLLVHMNRQNHFGAQQSHNVPQEKHILLLKLTFTFADFPDAVPENTQPSSTSPPCISGLLTNVTSSCFLTGGIGLCPSNFNFSTLSCILLIILPDLCIFPSSLLMSFSRAFRGSSTFRFH